jgi:hypothetical protein
MRLGKSSTDAEVFWNRQWVLMAEASEALVPIPLEASELRNQLLTSQQDRDFVIETLRQIWS